MTNTILTMEGRSHPTTILVYMVLIIVILLWGCDGKPEPGFQGYAEGEFVLVASPLAGQLKELSVQRGDQVKAGDLLFVLDQIEEKSAVVVAEQEVQRAASQLDNLRKGQRPSELRAIEARVKQAQTDIDLSKQEVTRRKRLLEQDAVGVEDFERAAASLNRNKAALNDFQAQLETARLGARLDVVAAGQAELDAAMARLEHARWSLMQKSQSALHSGMVFDTLFKPGEFVRAGYPVVSLLSPGDIIVRFFVPEPMIGSLRIGQPVMVASDGSDAALPATISFISPQAEYTPPVIYSQDTRAKLVFLVEARPEPEVATRLHPGQPVDVRLGD
jgi:HlyD family secretion protein